jgi:uncharacterized protein Yka (UPF0111/DUF47 family)
MLHGISVFTLHNARRAELVAQCKAKASSVAALNTTLLGLKRDLEQVNLEIQALESDRDAVLSAVTQSLAEHGQARAY